MNNYFTKDYIGEAFIFLGSHHLVVLTLLLFIYVALFFWRVSLNKIPLATHIETTKRRFRYGLAFVLLVNEMTWHAWNYFNGIWTVQTMLPLHLCSVLVFLSAVMLITKNRILYEVDYFLGIGGALQAILTPDLGIYGFPHLRFFQVFISHGGIVLAALYMTVIEKYRPNWYSLLRVLCIITIYALIVGVINAWLGSNYLFIAHKPETPSLIDILAPHPWYIFELAGIALFTFFILYLPFAIKDWGKI